ncbi:conserved hypothetical protein [Shouchella clausii KSM-K16]|uniref:DUF3953 domain-containing protein n=1 Tax=Shouchella clausii (strain KSM-K16) TaxID=66692 RepID=Q5WM13_SHOC1|nr:conserved hypothetical protein [Shouchella clausii KSM-K16]
MCQCFFRGIFLNRLFAWRVLFALLTTIFALIGYFSNTYYLQPLATLFSGLMILTIGLSEFKKERPFLACFVFVLSGFCIYVGIFTFIS